MKRTRTGFGLAVALSALTLAGSAEASKASAQTFCVIMDQTGELKSKCRVRTGQKTVDIRMIATAETAAVACPQLIKVSRDLKLAFAVGWTLRILPPGNGRQALAQCGF